MDLREQLQRMQEQMAAMQVRVQEEDVTPGIVHNPNTPYSKEMARWDKPKRDGGHRPNGFEAFPMMVYRAQVKANGQAACLDFPHYVGDPAKDMQEDIRIAAFNRSCQMIVRSADELDRYTAQGWYSGPAEALEGHQRQQKELADIAAARHFQDARLGELARAEAQRADDATHQHVPAIPETPIRPRQKPGRKPKTVDAAV